MKPALLALLLAACGETAQQEAPAPHPALADVERPPLNKPLKVEPEPARAQVAPALPDDSQPALLMLDVAGRPFHGEYAGPAEIEMTAGELRVRIPDRSELRVLLRTPPGLGMSAVERAPAEVELRELSGPQGADRQLVVRAAERLLLGEVWRSSEKPIDVALSKDVHLVQRGTEAGEGYVPASLEVVDKGEVVGKIPVGETLRVPTSLGALDVHVLTSHRLVVPADEDHAGDRYILHAWATAAD